MLKLKRFKEGTWFDWPELDGVKVKVRPVGTSKAFELAKKHRKKIVIQAPDPANPRRKINEVFTDVDEASVTLELFNYALEDWEGITLSPEEGEPEPSREEVKKAIFDHDELRRFIIDKARELLDKQMDRLEEERKNLESSQSG
jgi:hypothetical protein